MLAVVPGIVEYNKSPSGRAKCFTCGLAILKGEWRFEVALKMSSKLADQRKVHFRCAADMPFEFKEQNIRMVQMFLEQPGIDDELKNELKVVHDALVLAAAASASGPG